MSTTLQGRAASPGAALAPAFLIHGARQRASATPRSEQRASAGAAEPATERQRADDALGVVAQRLEDLADKVEAEAGEDEAAILLAQSDFAADPELAKRVHRSIDDGANAEEAVRVSYDSFRRMLEKSSSEYLASRATDIDDVRDQVLDVLAGVADLEAPDAPSVICAAELTPSQTARLPRAMIAGIACETGSPSSHAAILSRSLGIPAVVGVTGLLKQVAAGDEVAVDGNGGYVVAGPSADEREDFRRRLATQAERHELLAKLAGEPGRTADGRHVELAANVDDPGALELAKEHGVEGSGLVRTELLFLEATEPPTIDEQVAYYQRVLAAFPGQRVVFRTMDIGADKPLPFIRRAEEENPALGVRGLRLGLAMPDLLRDQLTALLRAGVGAGGGAGGLGREIGRVAIMFPMVSLADELVAARQVLDEVARVEGLSLDGIEVGAMVEVPSAALGARRLARHADFLSVGTNDLLQYLYAADRLVADVAGIPDPIDPDVLWLLGQIAEAAHAEGAWVGVCGQVAADPLAAAALVGLGFDELSMSPASVPEVKDLLRRLTTDALHEAAQAAIAAPDRPAARDILQRAVARRS